MKNTWRVLNMKDVVVWGSGGTPKSTIKEYYGGDISWLMIGDLNDNFVYNSEKKITKVGLDNCSAKIVPVNTLLVAMYGSIGKLGITGIECCTNQAIAYAKELKCVDVKYMFYYLKFIKNKLIELGKGGTQKNISLTVLNSIDVIVPPIKEQEKIVLKIEELLSKLDNGIDELNKAKDKLAVYRQAVLKEAFDGVGLGDITDYFVISGGLTKNSKRNELKLSMPYIRVANVYYNKLDLTEIKTIGVKEQEIERTKLEKNDLLFVEGNGSKSQIGRVAIWNDEIQNCLHQNHIIKGRPNEKVYSLYALYYLMSKDGRKQILDISSSTSGLYTLSVNKIKSLKIPIHTIEKQKEIVLEIESKLSICDNIENVINESLEKSESLRQSILKKAFDGKLV